MTYRINEIFYSIQGEGARSGTANVFVRFSGCNLQCDFAAGPKSPGGFACDTDFSGGREMTLAEVYEEACDVGGGCKAIIWTGGEPALQLDRELVEQFKSERWHQAIETNGTQALDHVAHLLDFVTVSPKTAEHTLKVKVANELRYVRPARQALPKPSIDAFLLFLSPVFTPEGTIDLESLAWCRNLVLENPQWRLSLQTHKLYQPIR